MLLSGNPRGLQGSSLLHVDFLWQLLPVCFLFDGQHKGESFYLTRQIFMNSTKAGLFVLACSSSLFSCFIDL